MAENWKASTVPSLRCKKIQSFDTDSTTWEDSNIACDLSTDSINQKRIKNSAME